MDCKLNTGDDDVKQINACTCSQQPCQSWLINSMLTQYINGTRRHKHFGTKLEKLHISSETYLTPTQYEHELNTISQTMFGSKPVASTQKFRWWGWKRLHVTHHCTAGCTQCEWV